MFTTIESLVISDIGQRYNMAEALFLGQTSRPLARLPPMTQEFGSCIVEAADRSLRRDCPCRHRL